MSQQATTFNLNAALSGHAAGMITGTIDAPTSIDLVVNLHQEGITIFGTRTSDKKTLRFLPDGSCTDQNTAHQLYLITDSIPITSGSGVVTRGDGATPTITIETLNPREQIATQIMASILTHRSENIELISEATINNLANVSFIIAQAMLNTASTYRTKDTITSTTQNNS